MATKKNYSLFGYIEENVNQEYTKYGQNKMSSELSSMASKGSLPKSINERTTTRSKTGSSLNPLGGNDGVSTLNPLSSKKSSDRKYMSVKDRNKYDTDEANKYIEQYGYLDKDADKDTRNKYYSEYMKSIGYADDEIKQALGFGGQVSMNEGFLGKVNSSVRNALAPGYDEGAQILANLNAKNSGSKVGNVTSSLIGNTAGLMVNPGGGLAGNTNLLNVADDFAEGVASKVAPKLGNGLAGKVATRAVRGGVDGAVGGGLQTLKEDDSENLASNVASGALGGALMFGGSKALGEVGNSIGKNIDNKFNALFDDMDGVAKGVDTDGIGLQTPLSRSKVKNTKVDVPEVPKVETTNVDVSRDLESIKNVGDRGVKLLSNEMAELKPYIKEEASATLRELDDVIKGERFAKYDDVTGETVVTGTSKQVSSTVQAIQDLMPNVTYDKIRKGLNDIVDGKDTSIAKKIELILDDNLSNGRLSGNEGFEVPANNEYLWIKQAYEGMNKGDNSTLFGAGKVGFTESRAVEPKFDNTMKKSDLKGEAAVDKVDDTLPLGNSKFANDTVQNKHDVPIEYKQAVEKLETSYNVGNNAEDNLMAQELIGNDVGALAKWFNGGFETMDKGMDTHVGMELAKKALADGDINTYSEVISKLSERASKNGQDIQALAFYNSQTPEGMAVSVTKNMNKIQEDVLNGKSAKVRERFDIAKSEMNEEQLIKFCKDNKIPYLDSEQLSNVQEIQKQILAASDEKEIIRLTALRNKEISSNIPKSTLNKINDYRYKSMLFNPKTLLSRNPIASLARMGTDAIGNPLGVALDKLASNKTGLRTRFGNDFSQTGNVVKNSIDDMNFDFKNGVNTSDGNMYGLNFYGGSDKLSDKAFKWSMELGDRPFADTVENAQLLGYMKENGISDIKDVPSDMRELFKLRGKENNFQNKNYATNWINKGKNLPVVGQLLDATMPFANTNLNILQDTVERSPIGLAKGLYDYKKVLDGNVNGDALGAQKRAVDEITKGTVGLGTTALGYGLADNLTGNYSNDSKVKGVQQDMGMRENALQIGDYNLDLSQLSTLMPNMVLGKYLKDNGLSASNIGNGIGQQVETAIKSSPFSGLTNFTDDMSEYGLQTAVTNLAGNYANQYVPTVVKQTNNLIDPIKRDTYSTDPVERQANTIMSGIPGLSTRLDSQYNTLGEEKLKYPNMGVEEAAFNTYLNPFLTSKSGGDDYEQLQNILNAANESGDSSHIPSRYSKTFSYTTGGDRTSYNLSKDEMAEWKRLYAKYSKNAKSQEQFQEALKKANDDMKAKVKPRNAKK